MKAFTCFTFVNIYCENNLPRTSSHERKKPCQVVECQSVREKLRLSLLIQTI
jgi:hypothetical protein